MTIQEQAFITYYASMTDAELLQVASNKTSLIEVAQKTLGNELVKRNLVTPVAVPVSDLSQMGSVRVWCGFLSGRFGYAATPKICSM